MSPVPGARQSTGCSSELLFQNAVLVRIDDYFIVWLTLIHIPHIPAWSFHSLLVSIFEISQAEATSLPGRTVLQCSSLHGPIVTDTLFKIQAFRKMYKTNTIRFVGTTFYRAFTIPPGLCLLLLQQSRRQQWHLFDANVVGRGRGEHLFCVNILQLHKNCQTLKVKVSKPLEQNGALNRRGCLVVVGESSQLLVQKQLSNSPTTYTHTAEGQYYDEKS